MLSNLLPYMNILKILYSHYGINENTCYSYEVLSHDMYGERVFTVSNYSIDTKIKFRRTMPYA